MSWLHRYESEADLSSATITDRSAAELGDPDENLELREDFSADLKESLTAVASGDTTSPAKQVAQRLGLT